MSLEELVRQAAREHWEAIRCEWEEQGFVEPGWDDLSSDTHVFYMKQAEIPVAVACRERDATIARLEAEVERLRDMVRRAYNDGFGEGIKEHTTHKGGNPWSMSKWPAALTQEKTDG
jgi:hypothetical protein